MKLLVTTLCLLVIFVPLSASAQEIVPGNACSVNGALTHSSGTGTDSHMMVCIGGTWNSVFGVATANSDMTVNGNLTVTGTCTGCGGGGVTTLSALTDTNITTPADASLLIYDTGTSTWRDGLLSGDLTITDTGVVTIADNYVLNTGDTMTGQLLINASDDIVAQFQSTDAVTQVVARQAGATSYAMFAMDTDQTGVTNSFLIGYGSTHPSQPNEASFKNSQGDITLNPGGGGSNSEVMRLDTTGVGITGSLDVSGTISGTIDADTLDGMDSSVFVREIADIANIANRIDSGFYEHNTTATADGWPVNGSWYHLIANTHSNGANYYSMQFAGDFYSSNNLYYRATNNNGTMGWNRIWHSGNDGSGSGLSADNLDGIDSANFVRDTGDESIAGIKTFTDNLLNHVDGNEYFQYEREGIPVTIASESWGRSAAFIVNADPVTGTWGGSNGAADASRWVHANTNTSGGAATAMLMNTNGGVISFLVADPSGGVGSPITWNTPMTMNASSVTLEDTSVNGNLSVSGTIAGNISGTASDLTCTDCIGPTEITDSYVLNTGDTMSGALDMGNNSITNVGQIDFNSGESLQDGTHFLISSNSGYLDLRTTDATHGLIIRDSNGGSTTWSGIRTTDSGVMQLRSDGSSVGYAQLELLDNGNVTMGGSLTSAGYIGPYINNGSDPFVLGSVSGSTTINGTSVSIIPGSLTIGPGTLSLVPGTISLNSSSTFNIYDPVSLNTNNLSNVNDISASSTGGVFYIDNTDHGEAVTIRSEDAGGTLRTLFSADPDNGVSLYYNGSLSMSTQSGAIDFNYANLTNLNDISTQNVTGPLNITNLDHGEGIVLQAENSGGTMQPMFTADPDGVATMYYQGAAIIGTGPGYITLNGTIQGLNDIWTSASGGDFFIDNLDHGETINLRAEDGGGVQYTLLTVDPAAGGAFGRGSTYSTGGYSFAGGTSEYGGVAIGSGASAGYGGYALGGSAYAYYSGIAIGPQSRASSSGGIALGSRVEAGGYSMAVGLVSTSHTGTNVPAVTGSGSMVVYMDDPGSGYSYTGTDIFYTWGGGIRYTDTIQDLSDRRLKKDIKPLSDRGSMLEKLLGLETYSFVMINDEQQRTEYGIIAQELEIPFPDLVSEDGDLVKGTDDEYYKTANYVGLIAPIIEALKEMWGHIQGNESEIADLKARVEALEEQNAALIQHIKFTQ